MLYVFNTKKRPKLEMELKYVFGNDISPTWREGGARKRGSRGGPGGKREDGRKRGAPS